VRENPFGEKLRSVCRGAGIAYGRADFGLVGGEPQIYEINTNPEVKFPVDAHPSAHRREAVRLFRERFEAALRAIDTPTAGGSTLSLDLEQTPGSAV